MTWYAIQHKPAQGDRAINISIMVHARCTVQVVHGRALFSGNILQMNLIELNKADRLGLPDGPIRAWIMFFKHWQEELTMANVAHEPVKKAMSRIRELSADEEARRLAFVRERALRDEVSLLNDAEKRGRMEGRTEGRMETMRETARNLINRTEMDDTMIAEISGLPVESVAKLRSETKH